MVKDIGFPYPAYVCKARALAFLGRPDEGHELLVRTLNDGSYKPAPYVSAEFFYLSQYQEWSTTALYAGALFPVGRRFSLDTYYEHQNMTSKHPNQQLNQLGVILNIYFGLEQQ